MSTSVPRRQLLRRVLLIALVTVLVVVAAGVGYAYHLTHGFHRTQVAGLSGTMGSGAEAGSENILMAGSTSRCALTVQSAAFGYCNQGVNGVNSDVIMILHIDRAHGRLALLSIPRDLFLPNARAQGANKIDAGLYEGLSQLVAAIEENLSIPIQPAVSLNFDQFANVVDSLGGINLSFPYSVYDAESGLNVSAGTCVHLNGFQALSVVRARHLQYKSSSSGTYAAYWPQEAQSDLARIRRDHEFLRVLGAAAARRGLSNPVADVQLVDSLKADLTFDQSWAVTDMAQLLVDYHRTNINAVPQLTLPVAVVTDPDGSGGAYIYRGSGYGDVEFPVAAADRSVIDQVLGIGAAVDPMTGRSLPAASQIRVAVLNGTGVYQQAADTARALAALGYQISQTGDTPSVGDLRETVVYYGSRSGSAQADAEAVADSLSGSVTVAYNPAMVSSGSDVTLVTGSQFSVAAPSSPPTSAGAGGQGSLASTSTSAPTTTSTTTPAGIGPATPPSTDLAPWDPRACPAGAHPTAVVPNPVR